MGIWQRFLQYPIKPFLDPEPPSFPLMQSAGGLTEPGPFPPQRHNPIAQGQTSHFQNKCP